jgi:uncharacterized protein involved in exopolysaccharide biosynthesis
MTAPFDSVVDTASPSAASTAPEQADINLVDLLIALGHEKWVLIGTTVLAAVLGVVVSLTSPHVYTARTTLMPGQQSGGGGGLAGLGNLAGLAGLAGLSSAVKSSDEMFIAFMRSQSVQSALIEELDLKNRYQAKTLEDARQALDRQVAIAADKKSGLIAVMASDGDPAFAAQLANAQVEQLSRLMSRLAVTEAQQRRLFYEQQIDKTQKTLVDLDVRYRAAQQKTGIQMASSLAESDMQAGVSLRSQIATKEIQLQSLSQFATRQNPEVVLLAGELSVLRGQLQKYERGTGQSTVTAPLQQEALQAFRELKTQEAMLDAFVRQLEVAKIDESKEGPTVQVVDLAIPPEVRAQPQRKKMVIAFAVVGLAIGLVLAILKALMRHLRSSPDGRERLGQFSQAWGLGVRR